MRSLTRLFLVAAVLAAPQLHAQSADDIVAKYVARSGGADRIHAVTTIRRVGKFYGGGGFEAVQHQENKRPNLVRDEFALQGMLGVNSYNGATGWKIEPWNGKKDAEALGEGELKSIIEDAEFDDPLIDYKAKGNTLEMIGTDQIEGTKVYKLKLSMKSNGDVRTYYIDADSYVPILYQVKRVVRGAEQEFEVALGDYKEVNGWLLPHAIEIGDKGSTNKAKINWEKIETNVAIDSRRFEKPAVGTVQVAADATATQQGGQPSQPMEKKAVKRAFLASTPAMKGMAAVAIDSETTAGLGARNIGSTAMSGRIAAIAAVHEGNRLTVFAGAASGGVWKSTNGGTTFKPVFDQQTTQSIGAITIDPTNPKVIWVGTGEPWTRNSVSYGDGIYKSVNGGDDWKKMGLPNSERIAKILIDPTSTNTVYACVVGHMFDDSMDRGVYRTTDGGATWSKILAGANGSTGCSLMTMDPKNPKVLYAGMWDFRRKGWTFRSGGENDKAPSASAMYKSTDGGTTWAPLDESTAKGLPPKPWGRVAVTVAPSNPDVVYAFIEAVPPLNALYRSADGGKTWEMKDRSQSMIWRPFYFANLIVDPKNENKVYKPDGSLIMSTDGGSSFSNISGGAHGDFHDVWIDPENSDRLITIDDGGMWTSQDGGDRWVKNDNLPISQFYHVSVDMDRPYNVYGGLQDNSSWVGPSSFPGGITSHQWENMYGGDGFWMFVDPTDPNYIYAEAQGGDIGRINRKTHETRSIRPLPLFKEQKLRFNWNTPIHVSPTKNGTIYLGSQFLFRSKDFGQTWERISPDLTTNDPEKQKQEQSGGVTVDNSSAEMHTTIFGIAESPRNPQLIWVGTDDGNVQLTRDGGKTWTNTVGNIQGLAKNAWVTTVEAGHFSEATVYATFDLHTFGDFTPHAYRSTDYGKTWTSLVSASSGVRGYAHVIREDLVNPNLLFLGTENGLWVSTTGGREWARYKGGDLPAVAVRDLAVHPRDNDLVIATHGRGIWIIDDLTPLRNYGMQTAGRKIALIPGNPVTQRIPAFGGWANGDAAFVGQNPTDDAVITYFLEKRHIFGDMKLEVLDSTGTVVSTLPTTKRRGLSRVTWGMRLPAPRVPQAASIAGGATIGPRLLPGTYTVQLTEGDQVASMPLKVGMDPRAHHTIADRKAGFDLAMNIYHTLGSMTDVVDEMNSTRGEADAQVLQQGQADSIVANLKSASEKVDTLRKRIVATKEGGMITGEERLRENLTEVYGQIMGYEGRPSQTQVERTQAITRELGEIRKEFDKVKAKIQKPKIIAMTPRATSAVPLQRFGEKH
ncbi:MAG: sialidase [Gemmatimonadetes bacterium]|nr:sialidase [Gemmatimonadota bacterium]